MLVSTCCIDARAGGTIPGALGGRLVIRPTARGAHLLVLKRLLLLVLLLKAHGSGGWHVVFDCMPWLDGSNYFAVVRIMMLATMLVS